MRKNILILCLLGNPYQYTEGGFHKTIYELIEYFKDKDIDITLITSNTSLSEDRIQQKYTNINFVELALSPEWIKNQDNLFINADFFIIKIQNIISNCNPFSLIHSLHWFNGYLAAKINKKNKIFHIHSIISSSADRQASGFELRSHYQRQCENYAFEKADLLISITEAERVQLMNYYNVPSSKILVVGRNVDFYYSYFYNIYHTQISDIDKYNFNILQKDNSDFFSKKVFVYVGRLIEYKGIEEIIKAWESLYKKYKEMMPPLWIIGGKMIDIYSFRHILAKKIPSLFLYEQEHKIYWWGYMKNYGISTILQKSYALIMHSAFEPGGRVILEAMASNKPIIATPTGFAQTYIKDWNNGFQVEYQDINKLAYCMNFFIINEYLSSMMGINAKKTYDILKKNWNYFERMNDIYNSVQILPTESDSKAELEYEYPFLIDEFPYCDIKNDEKDLYHLMNYKIDVIEEITGYNSYIWRIVVDQCQFFIKQFYNQVNIQQLWNLFDSHKVITIWMQYYTSILSIKYSCFLQPFTISEKLFSYTLPYCEIWSTDTFFRMYADILKQLEKYESGSHRIFDSINDEVEYFKQLNNPIQYKHKYYTINMYDYELKMIFEKNHTLFSTNEICELKRFFDKIETYNSLKRKIIYGLNYGKSFLQHVAIQLGSPLLLPSSDIFVGELGFDEGLIFVDYYLQNHSLLKSSYYPRKIVLSWALLYCIELFISNRFLLKPNYIHLDDMQIFVEEFNSEM